MGKSASTGPRSVDMDIDKESDDAARCLCNEMCDLVRVMYGRERCASGSPMSAAMIWCPCPCWPGKMISEVTRMREFLQTSSRGSN